MLSVSAPGNLPSIRIKWQVPGAKPEGGVVQLELANAQIAVGVASLRLN